MIEALKNLRDKLLGRGDAAISIPTLDGACKPNRLLEDASIIGTLDAPEDLATDGETLYVADGTRVLRLDGDQFVEHMQLDGIITALACTPAGELVAAIDGRLVTMISGPSKGLSWMGADGIPFVSVNAIHTTQDGLLLVTDGSQHRPYEQWCFDMMELGKTGRVVALDAQSGGEGRVLRSGLRYAFGTCVAKDQQIWVSETWKNRLVKVGATVRDEVVTDWLPGYPGRINRAADGGWWLCAFAGRTHLIEFVLREHEFRKRMIKEVDPRYWIAPALSSGDDFLEPLQGAHVITRGVLKPYAPPRSYGLVIKLDESGTPVSSYQSRLDGKNHGAVAAVECNDVLYVLAKGSRRVLRLEVDSASA